MTSYEILSDDLDAEIIYILGIYREKEEFLIAANIVKFLTQETVEIKKSWENRKHHYDIIDNLKHRLKICAKDTLIHFSSEDTVRTRISRLIELGFVQKEGKVKTSGAYGNKLALTKKGDFLFALIEKLYPVLELVPRFRDDFICNSCDRGLEEACLELSERHLKNYLEELYKIEDFDVKQFLGENYSISGIKELLFWLVMNNSANEIIKMKYPDLKKWAPILFR